MDCPHIEVPVDTQSTSKRLKDMQIPTGAFELIDPPRRMDARDFRDKQNSHLVSKPSRLFSHFTRTRLLQKTLQDRAAPEALCLGLERLELLDTITNELRLL